MLTQELPEFLCLDVGRILDGDGAALGDYLRCRVRSLHLCEARVLNSRSVGPEIRLAFTGAHLPPLLDLGDFCLESCSLLRHSEWRVKGKRRKYSEVSVLQAL
jgi:hypothetical protein